MFQILHLGNKSRARSTRGVDDETSLRVSVSYSLDVSVVGIVDRYRLCEQAVDIVLAL